VQSISLSELDRIDTLFRLDSDLIAITDLAGSFIIFSQVLVSKSALLTHSHNSRITGFSHSQLDRLLISFDTLGVVNSFSIESQTELKIVWKSTN
jgi:hypothetical protein